MVYSFGQERPTREPAHWELASIHSGALEVLGAVTDLGAFNVLSVLETQSRSRTNQYAARGLGAFCVIHVPWQRGFGWNGPPS